MKGAASTAAAFTTHRSGALPDSRTEFFLEAEGAIALGKGGDASSGLVHFYEGMIIAGATDDATDDLYADDIHNFYGET